MRVKHKQFQVGDLIQMRDKGHSMLVISEPYEGDEEFFHKGEFIQKVWNFKSNSIWIVYPPMARLLSRYEDCEG